MLLYKLRYLKSFKRKIHHQHHHPEQHPLMLALLAYRYRIHKVAGVEP
jgi:hypothetical protein